ncbi:DUF3592 domain-containing protein [Formosimonas limnophila]|uniref:DUF3592 domain-containing protein n=1 Tax=Formosimonas limnophila TaxID=1384487 RepID=UPI001675E078
MTLPEVIGSLFIKVIKTLLVIVLLGSIAYGSYFLLFGIETKGTVVRIEHHSSISSRRSSTHIWISYSTQAGKSYETSIDSSFNLESYSIGETVSVLYLREEPSEAEIKSIMGLYGFFIHLSLVLILSYFSYKWSNRKKQNT